MYGYIDGIDWLNAEAMKYWSWPKTTKVDTKAETRNLILSGEYIGALKVDGFYERILKDEDGNCFMIARSKNVHGEATNKIEWVPQLREWMNFIPNGTCFLSECYLPGNEGSKKVTTLLGCTAENCLKRQDKGQKLHFHIFDIMAFDGRNYNEKPAGERFKIMTCAMLALKKSAFVKAALYYEGKELWGKLQEYLADGREGMVITRKDCPVYFKRTPARMTIKVKKEIRDDIDCFFTGRTSAPTHIYTGKEIETWQYWEDARTDKLLPKKNYFKEYQRGDAINPVTKSYYLGLAGSLEIGVLKDGKVFPIGMLSGLSEEIKANPKAFAMKPIRVTAMEIDSESGALRHGKLIDFRDDIPIEECTYEKIFG